MVPWPALLSTLLDALAPPGCAACDEACAGSAPFCPRCGGPAQADTRSGLAGGAPVWIVGAYSPPLSTAIVRLKYGARPDLSRPLARLFLPLLAAHQLPTSAPLVPVPMHPRRLATRGYNQATLLAQELARISRRVCLPRLLRRARETEQQVGKSRSERLENLSGAFALAARTPGSAWPRAARVHGRVASVVLVDDVITTGSTVRACAQALAAGGVAVAAILALASAEPEPRG